MFLSLCINLSLESDASFHKPHFTPLIHLILSILHNQILCHILDFILSLKPTWSSTFFTIDEGSFVMLENILTLQNCLHRWVFRLNFTVHWLFISSIFYVLVTCCRRSCQALSVFANGKFSIVLSHATIQLSNLAINSGIGLGTNPPIQSVEVKRCVSNPK